MFEKGQHYRRFVVSLSFSFSLSGLSWAFLGSPGLFWTLLGSPGIWWALLGSLGLSWTLLLGSPGLSWALLGSPGLSGPSWALGETLPNERSLARFAHTRKSECFHMFSRYGETPRNERSGNTSRYGARLRSERFDRTFRKHAPSHEVATTTEQNVREHFRKIVRRSRSSTLDSDSFSL